VNGPEQTEPAASPEAASLEAEANAALAGAPEQDTLPGEPAAVVVEEWLPFLRGLQPLIFHMVLPQWQVSDSEQEQWITALAKCCDQIFPGGPDGKYACWVQLVGASVAICGVRMIQNGGKLPPLGPKRAAAVTDESAKAA
jgi:hypothetical protein